MRAAEVCGLICRLTNRLYCQLCHSCEKQRYQILFVHPYLHPFRDFFAPLDIRFRSYIYPSLNNAGQYNFFNCFLTIMSVCPFEKPALQQRTIIEPNPSSASFDALLGFVFGVLSSSWARNLCSMCVCV